MPYKSSKQRAYLHAKHPEIARKWDKETGGKVEKRERYIGNTEMAGRKRVQQGINRTSGTLAVSSLGALGAAGALRIPGVARGAAKGLKAVRQSGRATPQLKAVKSGLKTGATGLGITSLGLGGASSFNSATLMQGQRQREPGVSRKKNVAKNFDAEIQDFPIGGEVGHRIPDEEIEKGIGDWKSIDQRERTQTRQRKTMRGSSSAAGVGGGLIALGTARQNKGLKEAGDIVDAGRKVNQNSKTLYPGGSRTRRAKSVAHTVARQASKRPAGAAVLGGAALVGGGTATAVGAKGGHTYQQHKINQRRRSNRKKSLSKSLFDSEKSRMKRADAYTVGTDITTAGLGVGAAVAGTKAKKKGFGSKVKHSPNKAQPPIVSRSTRGAKNAKTATALGAGAAASAFGSHRMKQSKKSSWQPYG